MNEILLDTHGVVWLLENDPRLGQESKALAVEALGKGELIVSTFSLWEIAMLHRKNRFIVPQTPSEFRDVIRTMGVIEFPVTTEIAILSQELDDRFPADPADRIIAATALEQRALLVTADAAILGWPGELRRHDARR